MIDLQAESQKELNRRALKWFVALAFGGSWGLWSLLWIYDVSMPSPDHMTTAEFLRFARFAAPGTLFPGISALVVTRLVLHESWRSTTLGTLGKKRFYLWSWLLFPGLVLTTILLSVFLGSAHFDPNLTYVRAQLPPGASNVPAAEVWRTYLRTLAFHLTLVPLTNVILPGLGEELGWRGFLQPRLKKAGFGLWTAMIITGAIWGRWHAPVMIRGQYPGHPYLGALLTIPYCVFLAIIFGWLRVASGSVWVVAVAHASLDVSSSDGVAMLAPGFDFALAGGLESLIGWLPLLGFIGWLVWSRRLPFPTLTQNSRETETAA